MTHRVLLLGNSHLAAPRIAHQKWPERWPGLDIVPVGGGLPVLDALDVRGGVLVGEDQRTREVITNFTGAEELPLEGIDAIVIVGAQLGPIRLIDIALNCTWPGRPSLARVADLAQMQRLLMSQAAVRTIARDSLASTAAIRLARRLGPATGLPVLIASQPRPSAALMERRQSAFRRVRRLVAAGEASVLTELFEGTATEVAREAGAVYLPQPAQTIRLNIMTHLRFTLGAKKLRAGGSHKQPPDDLLHANARYGGHVLHQIVEALGTGAD